ncbi:hypothetical protein ABWL39_17280 [Chitinivorax sp. PXF-14]|uniref:hypothetical protein n=1 Tax=Chitinivorax sp. PXF-14 TaxID=3230488 RepID=UPI003465191D
MEVLVIKFFGAPLFIGLASLAGKRWGQAVAGLLGGLPLVAGPIVAALWLQHGASFAAASARAIPAGLWAITAHLLLMAWVSARRGWLASLLAGWLGFLAVGIAFSESGLIGQAWLGIGAIVVLIAGTLAIPKPSATPRGAHLPKLELAARMAAALLLVIGLTAVATRIGSSLTGVLTVFPVASSVMPAFTLANAGRDALLVQLKGFGAGMTGLGAFSMLLASLLEPLGGWAFLPAIALSVAVAMSISQLLRRLT